MNPVPVVAPETLALPADERPAAPGARAALTLLLCINLFNYLDRQVLAAVEPQIRAEYLSNDPNAKTKMGLLGTAFFVSYMIFSPLFGWLGDRMSRWRLVAFGVILWSLASGASGVDWGLPLASAFLVLFLTRCFVGIGEAAYGPTAPSLLADLFPVRNRGRIMAWFYLAIPVGGALGYTLGGIMASMDAWRWAFYLVVPPGLLLGFVCFVMREPQRGLADLAPNTSPRQVRWSDYLTLFQTPSYVIDCAGMTAMTFAIGALSFWMPAYLHLREAQPVFGIEPVTFFGVLTALAGLVATLSGGILADFLRSSLPGSYFLVSGFGMLVGCPAVLAVVYLPFPTAWVFVFFAVFFLFFNTGPSNTILANVTHPALRSSAFAINIFVIHALGDVISPPLVGFVADRWGLQVGFTLVAYVIALGGLIWLAGSRFLEDDTRRAPTRLTP
jgi:MFS family permease